MSKIALIVGVGSGNSASFARALAADGYQVVLAARNIDKLESLCDAIGARAMRCDASSADLRAVDLRRRPRSPSGGPE